MNSEGSPGTSIHAMSGEKVYPYTWFSRSGQDSAIWDKRLKRSETARLPLTRNSIVESQNLLSSKSTSAKYRRTGHVTKLDDFGNPNTTQQNRWRNKSAFTSSDDFATRKTLRAKPLNRIESTIDVQAEKPPQCVEVGVRSTDEPTSDERASMYMSTADDRMKEEYFYPNMCDTSVTVDEKFNSTWAVDTAAGTRGSDAHVGHAAGLSLQNRDTTFPPNGISRTQYPTSAFRPSTSDEGNRSLAALLQESQTLNILYNYPDVGPARAPTRIEAPLPKFHELEAREVVALASCHRKPRKSTSKANSGLQGTDQPSSYSPRTHVTTVVNPCLPSDQVDLRGDTVKRNGQRRMRRIQI